MKRLPIILFALTLATVAEAPKCFRYAQQKHHTKQTLDKWADWRMKHPNWRPKITAEEICTVPLLPDEPADLIPDMPDIAMEAAPFDSILPPDEPPTYDQPTVPYDGTYAIPPYIGPTFFMASVPIDAPAPTPEPSTFVMLGSGLMGLASLLKAKK